MFGQYKRKFWKKIISCIYRLSLFLGISRFKYCRKTRQMLESKYVKMYSTIFTVFHLVTVPATLIWFFLDGMEIHKAHVGKTVTLEIWFFNATLKYLVFVVNCTTIYFNHHKIRKVLNRAFDLFRAILRNKFQCDWKTIWIVTFIPIVNITSALFLIFGIFRQFQFTRKFLVLFINFETISLFVSSTVEFLKSCTFLYVSFLVKALNNELKDLLNRSNIGPKESTRLQILVSNYIKVTHLMKTVLIIFNSQIISSQAALLVSTVNEVKACLWNYLEMI